MKKHKLKLTPQERPPLPPPPQPQRGQRKDKTESLPQGKAAEEREIEREIQKARQAASTGPRTASQSSTTSVSSVGSGTSKQISREMQITVYVMENEHNRKLFSRKLRAEDKQNIIRCLTTGIAKITWDYLNIKREALVQAILEGIISTDKITFRMVKKVEYIWIKEVPRPSIM